MIPVSSDKKTHVLCVYAFAVVIIPTIIHASVLLCCYCRCHVVSTNRVKLNSITIITITIIMAKHG